MHRSRSVLSINHILVDDQWTAMSPRRPMCPHLVFGRCPLVAGSHYTFRYTTALAREFAIGFRTTMRIYFTNEQNAIATCFLTQVVVA